MLFSDVIALACRSGKCGHARSYSWMLCFFSAGLCCMLMGDGLQLWLEVYKSKMPYVGSWVVYTLVYVVKFDLLGFALLSGY